MIDEKEIIYAQQRLGVQFNKDYVQYMLFLVVPVWK